MSEVWKDIPGYEGAYQVSSLGRVKSVTRTILRSDGIRYVVHEKILRPCVNKRGYKSVVLRHNRKDVTREVHTLVAAAFLGDRGPQDEQIRHVDGDPLNNSVGNLMYGTRSQNQLDLYSYRGRHHRLTPDQAREIRKRREAGETGRSLAKEFGCSESNISEIVHGRSFAWLQ